MLISIIPNATKFATPTFQAAGSYEIVVKDYIDASNLKTGRLAVRLHDCTSLQSFVTAWVKAYPVWPSEASRGDPYAGPTALLTTTTGITNGSTNSVGTLLESDAATLCVPGLRIVVVLVASAAVATAGSVTFSVDLVGLSA